ncbi:MAG: terminase small subunit [Planctomycetota bacterium]|jgi:phage terminase small subunit
MAEIVQVDDKTTLDLSGARYTKKQRVFMIEYLKYWNGAKAARRAGYSRRCAHQQAYENLRKPKIRRAIDKAIDGRNNAYQAEHEARHRAAREGIFRKLFKKT